MAQTKKLKARKRYPSHEQREEERSRDVFAAVLAHGLVLSDAVRDLPTEPKGLAGRAYKLARAMVAERRKRGNGKKK